MHRLTTRVTQLEDIAHHLPDAHSQATRIARGLERYGRMLVTLGRVAEAQVEDGTLWVRPHASADWLPHTDWTRADILARSGPGALARVERLARELQRELAALARRRR